jgi:hypothetical protein
MGQNSLWVVQYGGFSLFFLVKLLYYISGWGLLLFVALFDHTYNDINVQYGVIKCNAASNFRKKYGQYAF